MPINNITDSKIMMTGHHIASVIANYHSVNITAVSLHCLESLKHLHLAILKYKQIMVLSSKTSPTHLVTLCHCVFEAALL